MKNKVIIKLIMLIAAFATPFDGKTQFGYAIQGKISNLTSAAKVYLSYTTDGQAKLDSAVLKDGNFVFRGKLKYPVLANLSVARSGPSQVRKGRADMLILYLDHSEMKISATDSIKNGVISGSLANEEDHELNAIKKRYEKDKVALKASLRKFISSHNNSLVALREFRRLELAYNFNPDTAAKGFGAFTKEIRSTPFGIETGEIVAIGLKTNVGAFAPDFKEADTTGKPISLSDFRGKFVLLDFWASWCKPCREENANVIVAYNKHRKKNFEVLSVSLDSENAKSAWIEAIKKDKLIWTQISALKGMNSESAKIYGIKYIPSNFLINPEGKIIARNLRGAAIVEEIGKLIE